jgi:hypothetical protein
MARFKEAGAPNRAPQRIQNIERMLYVKALRLANGVPQNDVEREVAEMRALHLQLVQWMTNTEKATPMPVAADLPGERAR